MYCLTSIFLLLYKEIHQNIECKIIWKNSILNLKKRRVKSSVCKCAVQIFPSTMLQIPETAEPRHCTLMQCTVKQHQRLARLLWCRPSNFWGTGSVSALYLSLSDQEWHCLSRYYASPAFNMFWTPTLFKTKNLSEKRKYFKAVKRLLLKFKCNSDLYFDEKSEL